MGCRCECSCKKQKIRNDLTHEEFKKNLLDCIATADRWICEVGESRFHSIKFRLKDAYLYLEHYPALDKLIEEEE